MSSDAMSQPPVDPAAAGFKRTVLQQAPSSAPGRSIVQVLTELPPGAGPIWHTHPGEEVGYILAGTVEMTIAGQPTVTLHAGDPFLIPSGTPHNAEDVGPGFGKMPSTYFVDSEQPLLTLVDAPSGQR